MAGKRDVVGRISEFLDVSDDATVGTSMRIPSALREAAALAVSELQVASSTTALTADALRSRLEAIVMEAALAEHYAQHPEARPSLVELAIAAAEIDGNPLAARPELIEEAAREIVERHPDADADAVLIWAEARAAATV